jgi:hypothetical protein
MIYPKPLFFTIACMVLICFNFEIQAQSRVPANGIKAITAEKVKAHIDYLASDALLGRNTPSPGLDTAAAYITREFIKDFLQPVKGSYLNPVPLVVTSLGDDNYVELSYRGELKKLAIKTEFVPFENTASAFASGKLVFVGYGITAPELHYDDYANMDALGKVVLLMRHSPGESDTTVFKKADDTKYGSLNYKVENAVKHGAVGVLVVTDPMNHLMLNPRGYPWPSLYKNFPKDALGVALQDTTSRKLPLVHVGKEVIAMLFGSTDSLKNMEAAMDRYLKPMSKEFPEITVSLKTTVIDDPVKSNNVVGFLPGTDPILKNEILIIGAHYDHVGFMKQHQPDEKYIFNGADDNASGTSGLLAVAGAFAKAKLKTKRSVLFIAFSAEEKGLFGSQAYVRSPLFPLENTVAMINMDMISRGHPDTLHLEAGSVSPDITEIAKAANADIGFKILVDGDEFLDRSDQSSFYHKNIPFIMFFAGLHNDYHTVRDRPETIDPVKAAKIATLAFKTAWIIANDNKHYKLVNIK